MQNLYCANIFASIEISYDINLIIFGKSVVSILIICGLARYL